MEYEIWKDISGYEGRYQVSNFGQVKSFVVSPKGRLLRQQVNTHGYLSVVLYDGSSKKRCLVHRLVAAAFVSNPNNLDQVNHKDENKQNNHMDNLEWCNFIYNIMYGTRPQRASEGLKKAHRDKQFGFSGERPIYSVDENGNIEHYVSINEAARQTGADPSAIVRCLKGKRKRHKNREWFYENP